MRCRDICFGLLIGVLRKGASTGIKGGKQIVLRHLEEHLHAKVNKHSNACGLISTRSGNVVEPLLRPSVHTNSKVRELSTTLSCNKKMATLIQSALKETMKQFNTCWLIVFGRGNTLVRRCHVLG